MEKLKWWLKDGEGLNLEFKESFDPKNIAKEMTAFANSEGGTILLGLMTKEISKRYNQITD